MSLEEVAEQYANFNDVPPNPDVPTLPSQITDEERKLAVVQRLLKSEKNRVTVRGFELARLHPSGEWEQVARYKPGDRGHMQAKADAFWLNERHPETLYQARVLVSAEIPDAPRVQGNQSNDGTESGGVANAAADDAGGNATADGGADRRGKSTPTPNEEANAGG